MEYAERYHALLIGCDLYSAGVPNLRGCVNDIDAIEGILLQAETMNIIPPFRMTRLAAPRSGAATTSRYSTQQRQPTRDNMIAALQALAGPDVGPHDRVLIYYSGHGSQLPYRNQEGWHECLVTSDGHLIYDIEMNALIAAIARRTTDLTVVLDCCHSAGATRDVDDTLTRGAMRFADIRERAGSSPDPVIVGDIPLDRQLGRHMLQAVAPEYVAVVACQADEKAQEGALDGGIIHGFFTYSLKQCLKAANHDRWAQVRWADIWPRLLQQVTAVAASGSRSLQHPWIIGRAGRRIFGGLYVPQDAGFQISENPDGTFTIEAGTLLSLNVAAIVGVYGSQPERFPPVGTPEDIQAQIGQVQVVRAERATCVAEALVPGSPPRPLPPGARARMIKPGVPERLRVWLNQANPNPAPFLAASSVLQIVERTEDVPEMWVDRTAEGWEFSNDTNRALARVRLNEPADPARREEELKEALSSLQIGLESYARYNLVLRLAKSCNDPDLDQRIVVHLLDCGTSALLTTVEPKRPNLPELPRDANNIYAVPARTRFCIRLANLYWQTLYVTVFNCSVGGLVEFLGEVSVRPDDVDVIWRGGFHREPFSTDPDNPHVDSIDRIIAVATTRVAYKMRGLEIVKTVQQVIDSRDRSVVRTWHAAHNETWTAVTVPLKISQLL